MNRRQFLTLDPAPEGVGDRKEYPIPSTSYFRSGLGLERYEPSPEDPWDYTKAAHLLRRAMIGPREAEIRRAVDEGLARTIERLMTPFEPSLELIGYWVGEDPSIVSAEAEGPASTLWVAEKLKRREMLGRWWLNVIATSPVSIQERMTLFWHGHFTSAMGVVEYAEWMHGQNQLLRGNALGSFKEMTREITVDMAMLIYLNGIDSHIDGTTRSINENYARELMELFTMGPADLDGNPNYSQTDVREAARALSGWKRTPSPLGEFHAGLASRFAPEHWDSGEKTFLGRRGTFGARDVVEIIFQKRREQVALFICGKLYRAFVHDIPDQEIVAGMAATFTRNNWQIAPVIEQLLTSRHFYDPTNIGALHRDNVGYYLGLIRGMQLENIPDFDPDLPAFPPGDLLGRLLKLGQMPFYPPNVRGWPQGRAWTNATTLSVRQKFAIDVVTARITATSHGADSPCYAFDPIALARTFPSPDDPRLLCRDLATFLLGSPPTPREERVLAETLLDGGVDYEWNLDDDAQRPADRIRRLLNAIVQLPKFQLH